MISLGNPSKILQKSLIAWETLDFPRISQPGLAKS